MGGEADLLRRGKSKHGCNVSSLLGFEETLEWTSCGMREREREGGKGGFCITESE